MSVISLNSPESMRWSMKVLDHFGSWDAVRAASTRDEEGRWLVPWPPKDDCPANEIGFGVRADRR